MTRLIYAAASLIGWLTEPLRTRFARLTGDDQ